MKMKGIVIHGKGGGRKLGFPTANLALGGDFRVESGVYAGQINLDGKSHKVGIFIGEKSNILEAYILDFDGDLYGREIEVEIGTKIREVMKFNNLEELKKQIAEDIEIIKKL